MLEFQVIYFENKKGIRPADEFIRGLPKKDREKIYQFIKYLEEKGNEMPRQYCEKLSHSPLWELKVGYRTNEYRIFFCYSGKTIILLHGFLKKTDSTPEKEIKIAEQR